MRENEVVDMRERCPTCNMIAPKHSKWCITPVIQGDTTMETRKVEGVQSPVLKEELSNEN